MLNNNFVIDKYNQYNLPEGEKKSTCPLCSSHRKPQNQKNKVMLLDWERGLGTCCHCGEVIQLHTYRTKQTTKVYTKPVWNNNTNLSDDIVKWFEGRGISQITLRRAKVSEGVDLMPPPKEANKNEWVQSKTIHFNYFRNGELINIKYRTRDKRFKMASGAEKIMYNVDLWRHDSEVIICEGEMDALSFMEADILNVTSVPNGSVLGHSNLDYIDNSIDFFENKTKIYLALDSDEAGQNTTKELIRRFGSERCFLVDFNECKDANEYLLKYGKENLAYRLKKAKEIPLENVSSLLDWEGEFDDYVVNGAKKGFITGFKSFDNIFSTYTGQYIVVTGKPSSGKSDWVDMMCLGYNRQYGWKIAYASPENKPNKIHAGKLFAKIAGHWINKPEYLNEAWCKKGKEFINDNIKFIDLERYNLDEVLKKARELIFRFGIKVLVIDPYNKVRLDGKYFDLNDYTREYLIRIDEFCRKYDILIILVAHPVKPSNEERKTYEPDFYSIKGGGEFYDMSPHGLLVHRDYENELVKIKVLKVKFHQLGRNNAYCWASWNSNNGRYTDYVSQPKDPQDVSAPIVDDSNWIVLKENNAKQSELDLSYTQRFNSSISEQEFLSAPISTDQLPF